jgi:hypothetical protein
MLGHTIFDLPFLANAMANQNPPYPVPIGPTVYPYQIGPVGSLVMWMDASTIVANDGDPVTTWNNHPSASMPAISMSQATVAWKPIYRASGIGGLPSLAFSSSGYGISAMPANAWSTFAYIPGTFVMICVITSSRSGGHFQQILGDAPNGIRWGYDMRPASSDFKQLKNSGVSFPDTSTPMSSSFTQPVMFTFTESSSYGMVWYENQYRRGNQTVYMGAVPTRFMYDSLGGATPGNSYSSCSIAEVMFWSGSTFIQADITNLFTNYVIKKYPNGGFYQA